MMCIAFGVHRVYPNPFNIIFTNLSTCITPCKLYGVEIRISDHISVLSTVSKLPIIIVEAPLKTRMLHRPNTSLYGNLGGALYCGQTYIPFLVNTSGETPFCLVDEIYLIFSCSSNDDLKASILTCGLLVGVVFFGHSFLQYGLGVGFLSLALGGG